MKPQFLILVLFTFFISCQKDQIPESVTIMDCPFIVDGSFSLYIPCDWETQQDGNPGDGPSGKLTGNDEKMVYLCGPQAFSNLESVNIPDGAKNLETIYLEDGRIMMYTKVFGEATYLLGYAESSSGKNNIRFVVPNMKDHVLIRQILLTIKFE